MYYFNFLWCIIFFIFRIFLYTGKGHCVPRVVSTFQDSRVALLLYEVIINSWNMLNFKLFLKSRMKMTILFIFHFSYFSLYLFISRNANVFYEKLHTWILYRFYFFSSDSYLIINSFLVATFCSLMFVIICFFLSSSPCFPCLFPSYLLPMLFFLPCFRKLFTSFVPSFLYFLLSILLFFLHSSLILLLSSLTFPLTIFLYLILLPAKFLYLNSHSPFTLNSHSFRMCFAAI